MRSIFYFCILNSVILTFHSCKENPEKEASKNQWTDSTSIGFNKDRVKEEELQINLYLSHHSELKLTPTGTGLRYQITKKTEGIMAESGDSVDVAMKINLLDGKICYTTDSLELDQFLIDRSQVESGIQEGIKLMKEGEKGVFILPSNLAHGLLGDFETIPPMSPIVVNLELIKVIKNKTN
jgi:FKBP-type peptidyl-prolyl cis-trans isomerase FkpA